MVEKLRKLLPENSSVKKYISKALEETKKIKDITNSAINSEIIKPKESIVTNIESEIVEFKMDEMNSILNSVSDDCSPFLKKSIKAHLSILKIIDNPRLIEPCIDNILENLHQGIEMASTEDEIKFLRSQCSNILQTILLYVHAKLLMSKASHKERGLELIKMGDQQYFDCFVTLSSGIALGTGIAPPSEHLRLLGKGKDFLQSNFLKKSENTNESFKIFEFIKGYKTFKDFENEFYLTLDNIFEKLFRYRDLLGKSIILSELIRNHHKDMILHFTKAQKRNATISKFTSSVSLVILSSIVLAFYLLAHIIDLISFFYLDLTSYFNLWYLLIALIPIPYHYIILKTKKLKLKAKYVAIADSLSPTII